MSKFESATSDSWIRWWAIANARCNLACEQSKEVEWFVHVLKQRSQPLSCNQRNVNPSGILRWVTVTLLRGGTRRGKGKNTNSECGGKVWLTDSNYAVRVFSWKLFLSLLWVITCFSAIHSSLVHIFHLPPVFSSFCLTHSSPGHMWLFFVYNSN